MSALFYVITSCNPTKKLLPNEYLVDKVEVLNYKQTTLEKENLEAFFRQKPNRKLFRKVHFFVWWYNLFDEDKIIRKKIARNQKFDKKNSEKVKRFEKKNQKRIKKGKKPKIPKLKDKENPIFLESLRDIGEPPVILDSLLTEQTRFQLSKYLFSKGYFNNKVTDTIELVRNSKRATVKYILHPKETFTVSRITYSMEDEGLGSLVLNDTVNSLLKRGMQYDEEKMRNEQQRITDFALNNGYFYFENAYINYDVDSSQTNHSTGITLSLKKFAKAYSSSSDSTVYTNHPRFAIENIFIITEPVNGNVRDAVFKDTLKTKRPGRVFLVNDRELSYRRGVILSNLELYRGQWFKRDTAEKSYKQLLGLGIFKSVTIQFLENPDMPNRLDCYVVCSPLIKQSITTQTEGTNTSGNLGIDGSIIYQNRNFFRGGELVELKLQGAISAQKQFSDPNYVNNITDVADLNRLQRTFNTIQFGPELSFSVPRAFFPFSLLPFRKDMSPRTYIKTSLNYQSRPEFSRVISNIDYGFSFRTNKSRLKHDIIPFEAYLVQAKLLSSFRDDLMKLEDAFLLNSFLDHITTVSKYGLTYTSKENSNTSKRPTCYARLNLQSSGNILRTYFQTTGTGTKDAQGRYLIFSIPFAQFLKTDIDFRLYIPVRARSRIVYRVAGGIGKPLANLNVLPYEQSFFSGGPNGVRAWRARTLGPGSYDPRTSTTRYDKIGDIMLEGNFEYRFHILKAFNGAFFVDAGNIWRLEPDINKPGGQFEVNSFLDEIAIGGGLGLRWDLSFVVLRLDMASPLKDPKYQPGDRWTFDKKPWRTVVANFGIGYPF